MRRTTHLLLPGLSMLAVLLAASCGPLADSRPPAADLLPPQVQSVQATGPGEISISFDEEAGLRAEKTRITPPLAVIDVTGHSKNVVLRGERQSPGRVYSLEAEAEDARGNTASFVAQFYGYNARVPRLLINELTPRGSGNHPDLVELKVMTGGNMGGVVLYLGTPGSHDARMVFPPFEVMAGCFVLVHLKPTGDPAEVDETNDPASSGGFDASNTAYDFWLRDGPGLGGNNGVLTLCDRPGGACMDGVLYSNRTSQSDEQYGGFGSEQMRARAEELVQCGAWKAAGARVTPEDSFSPEGSTGTRSICRTSASVDTDSAEDWHVVPTRKATFGSENSDEVYVP
ncbi:MAG: hypothetical protein ACLQDL_08130 [Spirochaetia bacterium]